MKAEWRSYLGDVSEGQVRFALKHLPEYPPNSTQFKDSCWKAPADYGAPRLDALPAPKQMDEKTRNAYLRFKAEFSKFLHH